MTDKTTKETPKGDEEELQELLEIYLKKSEELEEREGRVLRQIELMRSTVSSLQAWNDSRKASLAPRNSVHVDANKIEEETKKIKEETMRIQEEIKQKIAENKLLQEEVERRKLLLTETLDSEAPKVKNPKKKEDTPKKDGTTKKDDTIKKEDATKKDRPRVRDLNNRLKKTEDFYLDVKFFDEKVNQLKEIEKKLRKESELRALESKRRQMELLDRIKMLEKESRLKNSLISSLRNSPQKS